MANDGQLNNTMVECISHNNISNGCNVNSSLLSSTHVSYTMTGEDMFIIICFTLILILGVIGNIIVFNYFYYVKGKKRIVPDLLFSYLAIIDLASSICSPLLYISWTITRYKWYLGYWPCKLIVPLGSIAGTTSSGIHIIVAFDRQRTILHPFKRHYKLKHIKMGVGVAFICALISNAHYAYNLTIANGKCIVRDVRAKEFSIPTIIYFFIQDFVIIITLAMTNIRIFQKIREKKNIRLLGRLNNIRKRGNRRIVRLLSSMALMYFILTLPRDTFHIIHIISWLLNNGIPVTRTLLTINSFLKVLHTANSCVNFFIYVALHQGFKAFLWKQLRLRKLSFNNCNSLIEERRRKEQNNSTATNQSPQSIALSDVIR